MKFSIPTWPTFLLSHLSYYLHTDMFLLKITKLVVLVFDFILKIFLCMKNELWKTHFFHKLKLNPLRVNIIVFFFLIICNYALLTYLHWVIKMKLIVWVCTIDHATERGLHKNFLAVLRITLYAMPIVEFLINCTKIIGW